MIRVQDLCKYYGRVLAVDNVSFEVQKGEIVGVLGPNGAGKSTTLRILTSYLPATSGIATVAGYDVMYQSTEVRANIGYLPESVPLYPEMRVEEYLRYRAQLRGVDRSVRTARLETCLERCRIREVRRRLIGTLSKGYRQRVGFADALLHDPPILILDEPTSGLDPLQIRETLATIQDLGRQRTILLSTHILSEVEAVCGRVIIIDRGRIQLDSPMAGLLEDAGIVELEVRGPADAVAKALQAVPDVAGVTSRVGSEGATLFEVRAVGKGKDLREPLAAKVLAGGWGLRRIDRRHRRLDDLFLDVVARQRGVASGNGSHGTAAPSATAATAS
jgi:ABC-2 type transport system ATP-binding protein